MSRFVAWIGGLLARARGRVRSIGSVGFVAVAVIGLVVAMFLADGFRATTFDLENPGVWVTNNADQKALVGRFNTQAQDLDSVLSSGVAGVDVAQDGSNVALYSGSQLYLVDPAAATRADEPRELPEGSNVSMSGGRYLVVDPTGKAWTGRASDLGALDSGRKADLRGAFREGVVIGRDGTVAALTDDGRVQLRRPAGDRSDVELPGLSALSEDLQVSLVGTTPVVLDPAAARLYRPGSEPADLKGMGDGPSLQLPSDDNDVVLVATTDGLVTVPLGGGSAKIAFPVAGSAVPVRPVFIGGCSYGAWGAGSPNMVVECRSGQRAEGPLEGVDGELKFRVNRSNVVLNELETGAVFIPVGDEIKRVDGEWQDDRTTPNTTTPDPDDPGPGVELNQDPQPPKAEDDRGWGARRNRPAVISVLDNDSDLNGDVLTVKLQEQPVPDATVRVVNQGRAIQVVPGENAGAVVTFRYRASDGELDSEPATVTVKVFGDESNESPALKPDVTQRKFQVSMGKSGSYDVLADWFDPEGDPILLAAATVDDATSGRVSTVPDGRLTYTAFGGVPGRRGMTVHVSDIPPGPPPKTASHDLEVEVLGDRAPPELQPDYASGVVGSDISVYPLRNDTDPDGDQLRLVKVNLPDDWPSDVSQPEFSADDGRIIVTTPTSFKPGTLVFGYEASDGYESVPGLIRVDVMSADGNQPPGAGVDLVLLAQSGAGRTVDLLVNDHDPDGDVLMVSGVQHGSGTPVRFQLLEHRGLWVEAAALTQPTVLNYTLTDGTDQVDGVVIVAPSPISGGGNPPLVVADSVTVRTGDVISIPVLANDVDPDGDQLRVLPTLSPDLDRDQGTAFVSGNLVRFVAANTPGTVHLTYSVSDTPDGILGNTASTEVTINVRSPQENRHPEPRVVEARVLAGNTVKVVIPLAGTDPDGDSVGLIGLAQNQFGPARGRIVMPIGTDSITYEAFAVTDPAGAGGSDEFSYRVRDSRGAESIGTVRLVVGISHGGAPPVARPNEVRIRPGHTAIVPVLADDYDPDGDPISFADPPLGELPDGVSAEVDGSRVRVTAPGGGDVRPLKYYITDRRSSPVQGEIKIIIDPQAPGLPPIARDDVARPDEGQKDVRELAVDVRGNDEDPDGDPDRLDVSIVSGPGTEQDDRVIVEPGKQPQVVVYRVTDEQRLSATAVIRVPAASELVDRPPELVADAPPIEMVAGSTPHLIELADYVRDPEGKPVRLTNTGAISLTPGGIGRRGGTGEGYSAEVISIVPDGPVHGPAAVMFEVTDGSGPSAGQTAILSIPFTVVAPKGQESPARLQNGLSRIVAAGEDAVEIDLADHVESDSGSVDGVTFRPAANPPRVDGLDVSLRGSTLKISAGPDTQVGASVAFPVVVVSRNGETTGEVAISVVATTKDLPACADIEIPDADAGKPTTRDLNCSNPFPDTPLIVSTVTADSALVSGRVNGMSIEVMPAEDFNGPATLTYTVTDAAHRQATGRVRVNVRDEPGIPGAPTLVREGNHEVVLNWTAPSHNGAEILGYLVSAPELASSPFKCEATQTTCTVTGLTNDVEYHFSVVAENEVGRSGASPTVTARPDVKPDPPTNVELTFDPDLPDGRLTATWTAARSEGSKVTGYEVELVPEDRSGRSRFSLGSVTELQLDNLENGKSYVVRVQSVNKALDRGDDWVESNSAVPAKAPDKMGAPTVRRVDDPLGRRIEVSWTPPANGGADIEGFQVNAFREGACGGAPHLQKAVLPDEVMPVVIDLGDTQNRYEFSVVARNKAGTSEPGVCSKAISSPAVPGPIGAVTPTAADGGGVTGLNGRISLRLTAPADGGAAISRYEVSVDGGPFRPLAPSAAGGTVTLTVSGLTNGTPYRFRVQACNEKGCGGASPEVSETPYGPIAAPGAGFARNSQDTVWFDVSPPPSNGRPIVSLTVDGVEFGVKAGQVSRTVGCGKPATINVVARDQAGQTSSRPASGNAGACPPPPSITINWGSSTSVAGCTSGCQRMTAQVWNFPPNKPVVVTCQYRTSSTGSWRSDFGWNPPDLTTDSSGYASTGDNGNNCVGNPASIWEYRYVIDGMASPAFG